MQTYHMMDQQLPDFLPKPWSKGVDLNGQPYFVNTETGQIRRTPPVTLGFNTYQKEIKNTFIDPEQWDLVIETMASTIHPQQQLRIFQKLKKIAEKMITKNDPKYRTLYLNNPKLQHTVLAFDGGLEFLYNLGFEPHEESRDKLVCHEVNNRVVQACLICLEDKIEVLSDNINAMALHDSSNSKKNSFEEAVNSSPMIPLTDSNAHLSKSYENIQNAAHQNKGGYQHNNGYNQNMNGHNHGGQVQNDKDTVLYNLSGLGFKSLINSNKNNNNNGHHHQSHHAMQKQQGFRTPQIQSSAHPPSMIPMDMNAMVRSSSLGDGNKNRPPPPNKLNPTQTVPNLYKIKANEKQNFSEHNPANERLHRVLGKAKEPTKFIKTFIFIRHGNSIWNRFKNQGRKKKFAAIAVGITEYIRTKNDPQKHKDTWVVDAPLSRVGIDEAYGLSRFLGRHLTLRQYESLADLKHHQALANPIKDALRILQTGILDPYQSVLQDISPDLLRQCKEVRNIMEEAHGKIQGIMLQLQSRKNGGLPHGVRSAMHNGGNHGVTRGGGGGPVHEAIEMKSNDSPIANGSNDNPAFALHQQRRKSFEEQKRNGSLNKSDWMDMNKPEMSRAFSHVVLVNQVETVEEHDKMEMPLDIEWVLDQMVDASRSSVVVASNLRRAISTAVIALWDRFGVNNESIHILPCLQEIGMHVDTHTPVLDSLPEVSNFEKSSRKLNVDKLTNFYSNRLKVDQSVGSKKSLKESNQDSQDRLNFFCDWAFKKNDEKGDPVNTIITVGHSHWYRAFFKSFLPKESIHMAGKRKLQNCAVVGFRMICYIEPDQRRRYEIIDRSITPIYRGFV